MRLALSGSHWASSRWKKSRYRFRNWSSRAIGSILPCIAVARFDNRPISPTSGRMIAKHYLAEEIDDRTRIFATEDDLELYKDYVLVERGEDYRPPENIGVTYADLMVK